MSGHGQRGASSAVRYFGATRPERMFLPGDLVRFEPPAGAYSPRSEQARVAGTPALVVAVWNDSQCAVAFGDGKAIVVDSSYLTRA